MSKKTVLVTGASSGIGKETAKTLIREGYTVYTAARRIERMEDLFELGGIPIKMDITKDDEVVAAVEQIQRECGGVDILINNAGFALNGPIEDIPIDDARYQFEVNLFGLARLTQLVLPYMREKRAGKIVNVSSASGKIYFPLAAWYIATKHALEGWSDCLRLETKPFNIDVIIIQPGVIGTEFGDYLEPMLKRSGKGPYSTMTNALAKVSRDNYLDPNGSSPPSLIANIILKAIKSSRPGTRYAAGKSAKPLIFARKWFGDRFFDRVLEGMIR
ncbi:MAG: SDR family NAD(P)-dependent oxidoreductase [Oscillatoria sp. SIO1A7]|nr:SDR family NAD(P)-dependent oxidoreductase [Oscillatoria sp. SIO1A7]